jgi:hypothetical protein
MQKQRTASFNSVVCSSNSNSNHHHNDVLFQQAPTVALNNHIRSATLLPIEYTPGNWDVICIRGKDCPKHVGNRRFRICIENHVHTYRNAKTRQDKSCVITSIVRSIKDSSPQTGGFVMKVNTSSVSSVRRVQLVICFFQDEPSKAPHNDSTTIVFSSMHLHLFVCVTRIRKPNGGIASTTKLQGIKWGTP